jgi:hypothetical protein
MRTLFFGLAIAATIVHGNETVMSAIQRNAR